MLARITSSFVTFAAIAAIAVVSAQPSFALTAKECSAKYKAAKTAGTLNGQSWNEFRKSACAGAAPVATDAKAKPKPAPAAATAAPTAAVFPKLVDPKYAKKSAGKARFYTCLDQYKTNKATNGNGGLKWIEKGGGYYSKCNTALKG